MLISFVLVNKIILFTRTKIKGISEKKDFTLLANDD